MRKKNRETEEEEAREITKTGEASVRTAEKSEKESRVRFGKEMIKYEKNARLG